MEKLKFNPDNAKYYSEEFIKGFECGVERQFNADMKEKTAGWIPVSERLPEYDEDIIITHKGAMGQLITSVSYYDGDFRTEDGDGYFSDVMAWMPLPEPYKAE